MPNHHPNKKSVKLFWIVAASVFAILWLHGCKVPGMHQPEIEQGNIITQKMVDKLRPKMTRAQVEFVLGKPVYQNPFDINRWDYVFTKESRTGERERKVLTLRFEEDELAGISGDYRPQGDAAEELEPLLEPSEDDGSDGEEAVDDQIESIDSDPETEDDVETSN